MLVVVVCVGYIDVASLVWGGMFRLNLNISRISSVIYAMGMVSPRQ